jgi:hypothetical protein
VPAPFKPVSIVVDDDVGVGDVFNGRGWYERLRVKIKRKQYPFPKVASTLREHSD